MDYHSNDGFELLAILLVSHGSGGSHLLFKYPFSNKDKNEAIHPYQYRTREEMLNQQNRSPYSYASSDNTNWIIEKEKNLITDGLLCGLNNDVLAALCIMGNNRLELKIDNVFFLSSHTILKANQAVYNIVFAVRSPLPRPVIRCYQTLSLSIAKALMKEESNAEYLSNQAKILNDFWEQQNLNNQNPMDMEFVEAFKESKLAQEFKKIYESIKKNGVINLLINNFTKLSFCLPHLAYKISDKHEQTQFVDIIFNAIKYLKPYFGFLLLVPQETLMKSLPPNCSFYTQRLIELYNPSYCLTHYAAELDVSIEEVYGIVDHLIHWAKIKVIYPITETNAYVVQQNINIYLNSNLHEHFNEAFKDHSFHKTISQFSYAKPLVEHMDPQLPKKKHVQFINMLIWLLQQNALVQIHTFVFLLPRKVQHQRLSCEYSKMSGMSIDEESEYIDSRNSTTGGIGVNVAANEAGSENSNDTENTDQKDLSGIYEKYREIFIEHNISDKDQQYIFKAFEHKSENDIDLFIRLMPYYNGTYNIEAIIFYEKLNRSDMITFLDKFKDLLIVTEYEDPNPLIRINSKIN